MTINNSIQAWENEKGKTESVYPPFSIKYKDTNAALIKRCSNDL